MYLMLFLYQLFGSDEKLVVKTLRIPVICIVKIDNNNYYHAQA